MQNLSSKLSRSGTSRKPHLGDASCKIWLIWAGKINMALPNIMKIIINLVQRIDENWISYIPIPNVYMTRMEICSLMAPLLTQPIWVITRIILNCRKKKISVKLVLLENCQANLIPCCYYYYYYFGRLRHNLSW